MGVANTSQPTITTHLDPLTTDPTRRHPTFHQGTVTIRGQLKGVVRAWSGRVGGVSGGRGGAVPECRPIRMRTGTSGMWRILKVPTELRMSRDMLAISPACRFPLRFGKPEATM